MRKYFKYIIFILFIIFCVVGLIYFLNNAKSNTEIFTSEILIYKDNIEYEIKVNNKSKVTIFRENDIEEIIFNYPREGKCRLSLPNLDTISGENVIADKKTVMDYTYNISFLDGCKYLKYLIDSGYVVEMYVSNSQYYEVFLKNNSNYKRLVLLNDSLMICDMALETTLPNVWEYLKDYNYNGFLENKFDIK